MSDLEETALPSHYFGAPGLVTSTPAPVDLPALKKGGGGPRLSPLHLSRPAEGPAPRIAGTEAPRVRPLRGAAPPPGIPRPPPGMQAPRIDAGGRRGRLLVQPTVSRARMAPPTLDGGPPLRPPMPSFAAALGPAPALQPSQAAFEPGMGAAPALPGAGPGMSPAAPQQAMAMDPAARREAVLRLLAALPPIVQEALARMMPAGGANGLR